MSDTSTHDIRLELSDPRELFQTPELDPLAGQPYAEPGVERILNRIRPKPGWPVRTTLRLPAAARSPDLEARVRAGLQQYSDIRVGQITHDIASLRQEGLATLWRGVLFLALFTVAIAAPASPALWALTGAAFMCLVIMLLFFLAAASN